MRLAPLRESPRKLALAVEHISPGPDLFTREPVKFRKASAGLAERQRRLAAAEEEWLELEGLRESLA